MLSIGAEQFYGAIGIFQLQNSAESGFPADHAFVPTGSDDLVSPPAWSGLDGQLIACFCLAVKSICNVVCERILRLCVMGETGFEVFFPHRLSIDEQLVNTQARSHPFGGLNLLAVFGFGNKPARTVCRQMIVRRMDLSGDNRGVSCGYPLGALPGGVVKGVGPHSYALLRLS